MELVDRWDKFIEGRLQRLVQKSLGSESTDFLEAYAAALDEVALKVQSVGGKRLFPFKRVVFRFAAPHTEQMAALTTVLSQRTQLVAEVRRKLEHAGCENPVPLRVEGVALGPGPGGLGGGPYEVLFAIDLPAQPPLAIQITKGEGEHAKYVLTEPRINVGRLSEVFDDSRRFVRLNHVVFLEQERGINATVSRLHAHIAFDQDVGWYRLYDDRSAFGTRIRRGDVAVDVPPGSDGGAWLRPRDEIHFGQARVVVDFEEG